MEIELAWFPSVLMPNAARRTHWAKKSPIAAQYRADANMMAYAAFGVVNMGETVPLNITFYPPDKRRRDLDACLSAIKPGLDGIADRLKIDDSCFRPITIDFGEVIKGGKVIVSL